VPAVPVTLACQLVLYVDLDPSDDPTVISNPDALIRQAVAQTGAQQWNFHTPKSIPMAMRSDQQYYFTGEDKQNVRFTQQGVAYLIQVTNAVNVSGEPITSDIIAGSIFFDWQCNFNIPQINPESVVSQIPNAGVLTVTTTWTQKSWTPTWLSGEQPVLAPRTKYALCAYLDGSRATPLDDLTANISWTWGGVEFARYDNWKSTTGPGRQYMKPNYPIFIETDSNGMPVDMNKLVVISSGDSQGNFGISVRAMSSRSDPFSVLGNLIMKIGKGIIRETETDAQQLLGGEAFVDPLN